MFECFESCFKLLYLVIDSARLYSYAKKQIIPTDLGLKTFSVYTNAGYVLLASTEILRDAYF